MHALSKFDWQAVYDFDTVLYNPAGCIITSVVHICTQGIIHMYTIYNSILGYKVDVVDSFIYLGLSVDASGGNDYDIRRRIELARTSMKSLDRGIWRSSISLVPSSGFTMSMFFRCSYMARTHGV